MGTQKGNSIQEQQAKPMSSPNFPEAPPKVLKSTVYKPFIYVLI